MEEKDTQRPDGPASDDGYPGDASNGHAERNGHGHRDLDLERGEHTHLHIPHHQERLPFKQRVVRVTWGWFPVTMSTGALASLISQQPYTFPGLTTIGKIVYLTDVVLFVLLTVLIATRFAIKPRAIGRSLHDPSESFFFGAYWVSVALVLNGAQSYGVPECGDWLKEAMRILFWLYFACAGLVAVFQYHVIFEVEKLMVSEAVPAWILPAYPFLVTGVLSSGIASTQSNPSATRLIIAGIAGQGLGFILAFFIYTVYLARLINSNMPSPPTRPGMYVSVGPAAYTCAGLIMLGKQAKSSLPPDFLGMTSVPIGDIWFAISVAAALFLWFIAAWFSALSTLSVLRATGKGMRFSLQWWAFVFPNAGLAIATIQIGDTLDTTAIKAVGSAITVILVPLWFMCAVLHIRDVWNHELLAPGKDLGVDEVNSRHDEKQKLHLERKDQRRAKRENGKGRRLDLRINR